MLQQHYFRLYTIMCKENECFQGLTPQMTSVPHNTWLQAQRSPGVETSLLLVYQCQSDSFKRHREV